jgi:hypothetical protein
VSKKRWSISWRGTNWSISIVRVLAISMASRYGDEIGMGDDLRLPERQCARTPMQWPPSGMPDCGAEANTATFIYKKRRFHERTAGHPRYSAPTVC